MIVDRAKSLPVKSLTREQLNEKRRRGLCFSCDEPYVPGHVCKQQKLFMILPSEDDKENVEINDNVIATVEETEEYIPKGQDEEEAHITLHALSGHNTNETIKMEGRVKGRPLTILIDSGSTNNFLDVQAAKRLKVVVEETSPLSVSVADGFKVLSTSKCSKFEWELQNEIFRAEMRILPLGGIDAVLGVQWFKQFSPVTLDFKRLQLHISKGDKELILQGINNKVNPTIHLMEPGKFKKLLQETPHGYFGWLYTVTTEDDKAGKVEEKKTEGGGGCVRLKKLLTEFANVFKEPKGLPPKRTHDHHINLKEGSQAISLRPYRYPYVQKTEIEKMVAEMLKEGIIQNSTSPFACPVLLVRKQDNS